METALVAVAIAKLRSNPSRAAAETLARLLERGARIPTSETRVDLWREYLAAVNDLGSGVDAQFTVTPSREEVLADRCTRPEPREISRSTR